MTPGRAREMALMNRVHPRKLTCNRLCRVLSLAVAGALTLGACNLDTAASAEQPPSKQARENDLDPQAATDGPKAVALGFWQAAVAQDWDTMCSYGPAGNIGFDYCTILIRHFEQDRPVELLHLGEPFAEGPYPGVFVPYRVRFSSDRGSRVKEFRMAVRNDNPQGRYVVDGGI